MTDKSVESEQSQAQSDKIPKLMTCPLCQEQYTGGEIVCPSDKTVLIPQDVPPQPALKIKECPQCKAQYTGNEVVCPKDRTMLLVPQKDELLGQILNERYKVVEEVGRGGMSAVYRGVHELMDRTVAIKVLLPQLVSDQISIKRFRQEAQAASHLQHPNVITVYDYGFISNGQPYLVMDFLEGESLSEIIKRDKQVSSKRMIPIFMQACEALEHAHQKGVIHRDLKSSNIMLIDFEGKKDFVKVVDFGIAKLMPSSGKQSQNLTQTGEVFGSPIYMSPEQCMAKSLDSRSDIYSMGAMMYETLCGQPPLMGNSIIDTMQMHMSMPPKSFKELRPDLNIPEVLERVVMKALEKKPEKRYQSMQELRDALDGVSKLIDKEKLFGPAPVGRSTRQRARMTQSRPASMAEPPTTARMPYDSSKITGSQMSSSTAPPQEKRTASPGPGQGPKEKAALSKPGSKSAVAKGGADTSEDKGSSFLDSIKDVKLFDKIPLLPVLIGSASALVLTAFIGIVASLDLPKLLSRESKITGMVYYYKPSSNSSKGRLNLWVTKDDDDSTGQLMKITIPEKFNMDDHAAMVEGVTLGDIWDIKCRPSGNELIMDKPEFVDDRKLDGEDLRQILQVVKDMFTYVVTENEVTLEHLASFFMPDWESNNYKKLLNTFEKEGLEYALIGNPNAVPKAAIKVEYFDREQGKASLLINTKFWIKQGPRYMRITLVKKDNKKWLIGEIDEISPKIWNDDGIRPDTIEKSDDEGEVDDY